MKMKKLASLVLSLTLGMFAFGSDVNASTMMLQPQNVVQVSQNMNNDTVMQFKKEIGAFEITAKQRELAKTNIAGYPVLDAGRGNPNWINTQARYAFTRLMNFATDESRLVMDKGSMGGQAQKPGIAKRFDAAMNPKNPTDAFLIKAVNYCVKDLGMDKEDLLFELVNGIIGDYYPSPSRSLKNSEKILNAYLESILYNGVKLADQTDVFPTEGGSAAMCYIFHALSHNKLLNPGDKIAIGTPIFTPYLEIPDVNNYGLVPVDVSSSAENNWNISDEAMKKLENPEVKAFFLVNPSNPASHALSDVTLTKLGKVLEKNPNLIILTDDVYGTFVNNFQTAYARFPHNTILVYSYSKLYGATGWRIGMIAMNKKNVMDELLAKQSAADKQALAKEYSIVTKDIAAMKFIDRVTADSRSIGLYHTSGLSTPSQIFMDILSLSHLVNPKNNPYIKMSNDVVHERYMALMKSLGLMPDRTMENAQYYTLIDINAMLKQQYGEEFTQWKINNISDIDFLNDLAEKKGVVLMYGPGFEAPQGSVRISLANQNKEAYVEIARRMRELLDEYYAEFNKSKAVKGA